MGATQRLIPTYYKETYYYENPFMDTLWTTERTRHQGCLSTEKGIWADMEPEYTERITTGTTDV